jgi:hypothetical protein
MACIRSIHPDACESHTLAELSAEAERTWWRLLPHCDDQGRMRADPTLVASRCYAVMRNVTSEQVLAHLREFAHAGLIRLYHDQRRAYFAVASWDEYQHPKNSAQPQHPDPDACEALDPDSLTITGLVTDASTTPTPGLTHSYPRPNPGLTHDEPRPNSPEAGRPGGREAGRPGEIHDDDAAAPPSPFSTSEQSDELAAEADGQGATAPEQPEQPDPVDLQFVDFWDRYPRHHTSGKPGGGGSRKKALQRWRNLTQRQRDQALAAVDNYRGWCERDDGEFAAHATTWLSEERWEQWQQPAPPPSSSNGATPRAGPRPAGHEPNPSDEPVTAKRVQP